jgi:hypothetical protein
MNKRKGKTAAISAFALAKLSNSVSAEITVEDVLAARPDWTRNLAEQFLQAHGHEIAEAMAASGADALYEMLPPPAGNSDAN